VGQRVMITGISRHLPAKLARRLEADRDVDAIVGVDLEEPEVDLERASFHRADIRNPLMARILESEGIDTLVHLNVVATPTRVGGRRAMKEINVIGSLQLLASCHKARSLRKLVMKSTTAVYGASSKDPAVFSEHMAITSSPASRYAKDAVAVEEAVRDFGRRRSEVTLSILRFANFMGSEIETPLTRYFSLPVVPTALGHDPRIQLIHEDDAIEVLYRAVREEHPGIFNVAADGVLALSQAVRICGKPSVSVPLPLATPLATAMRRLGLIDLPTDQLQFLVYGRVADVRRLRRTFGYTPAYTTRGALEEFVSGQRLRRPITPERVVTWEERAYELLRRVESRA
jgi:UDP-glucose 4-epimerase